MNIKNTGKSKNAELLIVAFMMGSMLFFNESLTESLRSSLIFCIDSIIPSLFPFLIMTDIITAKKLYPRKKYILSAMMIGAVCGFPSGSKFALSLYRERRVSKKKAEYINAISNNAGLAFTCGFTAHALNIGGWLIFMIQLFSVAVSAVVLKHVYGIEKEAANDAVSDTAAAPAQKGAFLHAISSSVRTLSMICAFILVFNAISDVICGGIADQKTKVLIKGFFELSGGIKEASALPREGIVLGLSSLCWSGVCVLYQIKNVLCGELSIKPYIAAHLLQSAAAGAAAFIYLSL